MTTLEKINASDIEAIEKESRWNIHAWWKGGKIDKENLTQEARQKLLDIVESCQDSL